jgi:hypothetical protein
MMAACKARCGATGLMFSLFSLTPLTADANASAGFQVAVKMASTSQGVCVSEPLSEQTHAVFQVTCASGHFVSMSPYPGRPFVGTHGSAFQFQLVRLASGVSRRKPTTDAVLQEPSAEVTAMRVSSSGTKQDEQVEILVSF